jgi:hypothetical protein
MKPRGSAYISSNTTKNDLLFSRSLDGCTELGIVPGVDLAIALDQRRVLVHFQDLLGQRSIRSCKYVLIIRESDKWQN